MAKIKKFNENGYLSPCWNHCLTSEGVLTIESREDGGQAKNLYKNMTKINRFNESSNTIELTMDDVRKLHHNMNYRKEKDSFMKNFHWKEDQILIAKKGYSKPDSWDGKEVEIYDLYTKSEKYLIELGYAILINGEIKYLISIYEPHGCDLNAKRGVVTAHGHEQIIKLWLDDGEFEETYTR